MACYQTVYLLHIPSGCFTSSELFEQLERRLREAEAKKEPIRRFVFWDLTQLPYRKPLLARDPLLLPALMDYLRDSWVTDGEKPLPSKKRRHITSLFMGPSNGELARVASAMADNVLFTWQDRRRGSEGEKDREGVAVYVDRVEGSPGQGRLWFIPRVGKDRRPSLQPEPCDEAGEKMIVGADKMIRAIQELQGLKSTDPGEPSGLR